MTLSEIVDLANQYSGGHFDALNEDSKVLTAIAWNNFPSPAFTDLLEKVETINPAWAELINDDFSFFIIAEGDCFRASGFEVSTGIACDTEEWYEGITGKKQAFEVDGEIDEKLIECIDEFANDVCKEVEQFLADKNITLSDIEEKVSLKQ